MHFVVTDGIKGKQYSFDDYDEATLQYEQSVKDAIADGHTLEKGISKYVSDDGLEITKSWGELHETDENEMELSSCYVCALCGDAIFQSFGFCAKCKESI